MDNRSTSWNFALTTRFDKPVYGKRDFALEKLSSYRRRCDHDICGKWGESRYCDQAGMRKRENKFSATRMEGVWLVCTEHANVQNRYLSAFTLTVIDMIVLYMLLVCKYSNGYWSACNIPVIRLHVLYTFFVCIYSNFY